MSSESRSPSNTGKAQLIRRVSQELGRELSTRNVFLQTLIASEVGLNATDTRCLEILARSPGQMTAGALTEATGLTTGAITGILDRLEKAEFVKRERGAQDRRKVFIRLVENSGSRLTYLYAGLGNKMEDLASRYTVAELRLIEEFLRENIRILNEEIAKLALV